RIKNCFPNDRPSINVQPPPGGLGKALMAQQTVPAITVRSWGREHGSVLSATAPEHCEAFGMRSHFLRAGTPNPAALFQQTPRDQLFVDKFDPLFCIQAGVSHVPYYG